MRAMLPTFDHRFNFQYIMLSLEKCWYEIRLNQWIDRHTNGSGSPVLTADELSHMVTQDVVSGVCLIPKGERWASGIISLTGSLKVHLQVLL